MDNNSSDPAQEFCARIEAATADTSYRVQRTEWGASVSVDVNTPQLRELLTRQRIEQLHTHRVTMRPQEKTFTIEDVVRTVEYEAGLGGIRLGKAVSVGRSVYTTKSWSLNGTLEYSFSSADGHRLIRGAARGLGWRELRPKRVKAALGAGVFGAVVALSMLIGLAVAFWP
ncbi:hypothetical protein ACGFT2_20420 [Streptomyces sp. NPDC048514]|uniref:hypothetical protein n=1 Tax=Streptomyces sp. NPDC048514 TaxID=3365564 RepID=UPI0037214954